MRVYLLLSSDGRLYIKTTEKSPKWKYCKEAIPGSMIYGDIREISREIGNGIDIETPKGDHSPAMHNHDPYSFIGVKGIGNYDELQTIRNKLKEHKEVKVSADRNVWTGISLSVFEQTVSNEKTVLSADKCSEAEEKRINAIINKLQEHLNWMSDMTTNPSDQSQYIRLLKDREEIDGEIVILNSLLAKKPEAKQKALKEAVNPMIDSLNSVYELYLKKAEEALLNEFEPLKLNALLIKQNKILLSEQKDDAAVNAAIESVTQAIKKTETYLKNPLKLDAMNKRITQTLNESKLILERAHAAINFEKVLLHKIKHHHDILTEQHVFLYRDRDSELMTSESFLRSIHGHLSSLKQYQRTTILDECKQLENRIENIKKADAEESQQLSEQVKNLSDSLKTSKEIKLVPVIKKMFEIRGKINKLLAINSSKVDLTILEDTVYNSVIALCRTAEPSMYENEVDKALTYFIFSKNESHHREKTTTLSLLSKQAQDARDTLENEASNFIRQLNDANADVYSKLRLPDPLDFEKLEIIKKSFNRFKQTLENAKSSRVCHLLKQAISLSEDKLEFFTSTINGREENLLILTLVQISKNLSNSCTSSNWPSNVESELKAGEIIISKSENYLSSNSGPLSSVLKLQLSGTKKQINIVKSAALLTNIISQRNENLKVCLYTSKENGLTTAHAELKAAEQLFSAARSYLDGLTDKLYGYGLSTKMVELNTQINLMRAHIKAITPKEAEVASQPPKTSSGHPTSSLTSSTTSSLFSTPAKKAPSDEDPIRNYWREYDKHYGPF